MTSRSLLWAGLALALLGMLRGVHAQASTGDGEPLGGLLQLGAIGAVCAFLLWRGREQERDRAAERAAEAATRKAREETHAAERASAWKAIESLQDELGAQLDAMNANLIRIATLLERDR